MKMTVEAWHQHYTYQTLWTRSLGQYLFRRAGISQSSTVLEVGCGTGAVLNAMLQPLARKIVGLDIDAQYLRFAANTLPNASFIQADAHNLPIASRTFDAAICHFLLLWVKDPLTVLSEMARTTQHKGFVFALAEPDYGGRIDYPNELAILGKLQADSLIRQGADPLMGRKLRALFYRCGLEQVETGVLSGEWSTKSNPAEFESEWTIIRSDMSWNNDMDEQLQKLHDADLRARELGERVLFVPTFWACGRVP